MPSVKQCSKCSKTFTCNSDAKGCWCQNYTLTVNVLQELKDNFEDCLCPHCLSSYATDETVENQLFP